MKTFSPILAAILAISFSALAHGQTTIVASATQPTTTSPDITNFVNNGIDGNDYSDRYAGQIFTTLGDSAGYLLDSVTVQGGGSAGNGYQGSTFTLAVYSVSGNNLTNIGNETFDFASGADYSTDYLTLNLTAPVALAANTEYAFAFYQIPGGGYYGFEDSVNTSTYAGGTAININAPATPGANTTISMTQSYDKSFALEFSTAPEPSTWAMMFGGAAMLFGLLRFRRRTL